MSKFTCDARGRLDWTPAEKYRQVAADRATALSALGLEAEPLPDGTRHDASTGELISRARALDPHFNRAAIVARQIERRDEQAEADWRDNPPPEPAKPAPMPVPTSVETKPLPVAIVRLRPVAWGARFRAIGRRLRSLFFSS